MKKQLIFSPTLDSKFVNPELWGKVEQLNLNLVRDRLLLKHKWSEKRADAAIGGYRQYLYLTQMYGKPISPTGDIDEVWHEHILHTNKYSLDCNFLFGKFLHHFPTPSKWKLAKATAGNCSSPCCNHADCCNDNPVVDRAGKLSISENGILIHADCGEPAPGGCAPIGGSDDFCGGTTNDSFTNKVFNFDNPDMTVMPENILFKDIAPTFFVN